MCASHGVIASAHNSLVCYPILTYGNEAQKQKYLTPLAHGEWIGAYCLTEPNAGSNAANQQTTAALDGDHYVLNGTKLFVTNAGPAGRAGGVRRDRPLARPARASRRSSSRPTTPGVHQEQEGEEARHPRLGHARDRVRERARAEGEPARRASTRATRVALATLGGGRIGIAAQALGIAQASLEAAVKYAGERKQFDRRDRRVRRDPRDARQHARSRSTPRGS